MGEDNVELVEAKNVFALPLKKIKFNQEYGTITFQVWSLLYPYTCVCVCVCVCMDTSYIGSSVHKTARNVSHHICTSLLPLRTCVVDRSFTLRMHLLCGFHKHCYFYQVTP